MWHGKPAAPAHLPYRGKALRRVCRSLSGLQGKREAGCPAGLSLCGAMAGRRRGLVRMGFSCPRKGRDNPRP